MWDILRWAFCPWKIFFGYSEIPQSGAEEFFQFTMHNFQFTIRLRAMLLLSSLFFLHFLIFLPFFDHYFRVIQRKKRHLFSSKTARAMPKIVRLPRLRPSHSMVRPYQQRKRALVTLWLKPCRHTVWYSIAGGKMGGQRGFLKRSWLSAVYKLSQFLRISDEDKLIFK